MNADRPSPSMGAPPSGSQSPEAVQASSESVEASLDHSVRDGCYHAVMLGMGEAYLAAFAVFLGAGSFVIGLLASLPLLVGSLAQLGAVQLLQRVSRRKPLVTFSALLQALTWLPILAVPYFVPDHGPAWLLAGALAYFALGGFAAPPWNSWIGDLVQPDRRGRYFGRRDRLRTLWQFTAALAAGGTLSLGRNLGFEYAGFATIFLVALLARLTSTRHLQRMSEPAYQPPSREHSFSLLDFVKRIPRGNFGRFTIYVAVVQAMTFLCGPFFTLYMLRDLQFSYLQFTAASTVNILAQAVVFTNWGRVGDEFGNRTVLKWTGLALPIVPLLWLISPRFELILFYQLFSGLVWAGFNLSCANFLFDAVSPPKRARCVAYYNLFANAGVFLGALTGGWIAPLLPSEFALFGYSLPIVSNLQLLFLISGIGRLATSLLFLPFIREVREVEKTRARDVIIQIMGLSAIRGFRFSIFNGVHRSERRKDSEG